MCPPVYVGCQGWRYPDWRVQTGVLAALAAPFYGADTRPTEELARYSQTFDLVEVDATFYAIPKASVVEQWRDQTPAPFRFTLKLPRLLTHEARLRRGQATLAQFCDRARLLGSKLAAVLIQLPPSFGVEERASLERFMPYLPTDLPFAIEFRSSPWFTLQTLELLHRYRVALTLGETPWLPSALSLAWLDHLPTDWLYVRIMGAKEGGLTRFTHLQIDREEILSTWATALRERPHLTAYVLVDNHFQGFSPGTATLLKRGLGQEERPFPCDQLPAGTPVQLGLL